MKLLAGLGNPEPGMLRNRHNIGFMAVDAIARAHGFGPWRARFRGLAAEGRLGGEPAILLKPLTYMNLSGESVQPAAAFYKLPPGDIVVLHDELDLAPGKLRVKRGGGAAGHNGLRSIDRVLGSQDYWRVRIGIGHPGERDRVLGYVLGNFGEEDSEWLAAMLPAIAEAAPLLAAAKPEDFMTRIALLTQDAAKP